MPKRAAKNRIAIFVKAPVPGKVKTRLCPPLSKKQAAALYVAFVKDSLCSVQGMANADSTIFYLPARKYAGLSWLGPGFQKRHDLQTKGHLGLKMARAIRAMFNAGASKVVVIGSDAPHLRTVLIQRAFSLLNAADVVLGP